MTTTDIRQVCLFSFFSGLICFGLYCFFISETGLFFTINEILLFAICLLAPLELWLIDIRDEKSNGSTLLFLAVSMQPASAVLVFLSFLLPASVESALLCVPYFLTTGLVCLHGIQRLISCGLLPVNELAIHTGQFFLPVGSFWLLSYRLDYPLLGFDTTFVSLTAVHFHYAGFAAPLIIGLTGRLIQPLFKKFYSIAVIAVLVGIPLTAAGIYVSPVVEMLAAILLAGGLILYATLCLFSINKISTNTLASGFLGISSISIYFSMFLAIRYAFGEFFMSQSLTIADMAVSHGWLNAAGFSLFGLLSATLLKTRQEYDFF